MHEPLPRRSAAAAPCAQHVLHRDYETRSRAILKNVGTHKYAANPSTEILCVAYAVDHDPVQLWLPGNTLPPEFLQAALDPSWIVCAHNAGFEAAIEQRVLAPQYGWPLIPLERHRCTMAMALAAGLPARLSAVADAWSFLTARMMPANALCIRCFDFMSAMPKQPSLRAEYAAYFRSIRDEEPSYQEGGTDVAKTKRRKVVSTYRKVRRKARRIYPCRPRAGRSR